MLRSLFAAALLFSLSACVSAPQTQRNPLAPIAGEQGEGEVRLIYRDDQTYWWLAFNDEALNSLIHTGLQQNPSPKIAQARLDQAIQRLQIAKARYRPAVNLSGSLDNRQFRNGDTVDTREELGSLGISWDLGLWGKRSLDIGRARRFQEQYWFEHQSALLALSGSIAETYFQIVELLAQDALLGAQLQASMHFETLIEARFRLGQTRVNEVYQQREQTTTIEQLKLEVETNLQLFESNLDVLLGQPPDEMSRVVRTGLYVAPSNYLNGSPDVLFTLRPDIRAGYAQLQQAAATVGIRFAERLPSLTVTADLTSLATKTTSLTWLGQGANLVFPLFAGGGLRALNNEAQFALEEQRQRYVETWLTALEEVSALQWQYQQQQNVLETLSKRRGYAEQALKAARTRYALGDQNYLNVLTALRGFQTAERSLLAEQRILITLQIQLMVSIGQPMCGGDESCKMHWSGAS